MQQYDNAVYQSAIQSYFRDQEDRSRRHIVHPERGDQDMVGNYSKSYRHIVLKGVEIPLTTRISHINSGMWSALSNSNPQVVAINGIYPTMIVAAVWALVHRVPLAFVTDGWRHTMPQSLYHRYEPVPLF